MKYEQFLRQVIDGGIAAAKHDYAHDMFKRDGSVAGFEACRHLYPDALVALLRDAKEKRQAASARRGSPGEYWYARCFESEIEWVCNVVAAAFAMVETKPMIEVPVGFVLWEKPPVIPTARGAIRAATVLGVGSAIESREA